MENRQKRVHAEMAFQLQFVLKWLGKTLVTGKPWNMEP